jgi:hypothetical protein
METEKESKKVIFKTFTNRMHLAKIFEGRVLEKIQKKCEKKDKHKVTIPLAHMGILFDEKG